MDAGRGWAGPRGVMVAASSSARRTSQTPLCQSSADVQTSLLPISSQTSASRNHRSTQIPPFWTIHRQTAKENFFFHRVPIIISNGVASGEPTSPGHMTGGPSLLVRRTHRAHARSHRMVSPPSIHSVVPNIHTNSNHSAYSVLAVRPIPEPE